MSPMEETISEESLYQTYDSLDEFIEAVNEFPNITFEHIEKNSEIENIRKYCNPDLIGDTDTFESSIPKDLEDDLIIVVAENHLWNETYLPDKVLDNLAQIEKIRNGEMKVRFVLCNNPLLRLWFGYETYPKELVESLDLEDYPSVNRIEQNYPPFVMGINPHKGKNIAEIVSTTKPLDKIYGMVIESAFNVIWYSDITSLLDYLEIYQEPSNVVELDESDDNDYDEPDDDDEDYRKLDEDDDLIVETELDELDEAVDVDVES